MGIFSQLWSFKKSIIMIATPIVFLPVPIFYVTKAGRCAYAVLIMAVYWMTEVIPMAATAILPIALMPWLGVMGSKPLCMNYLKDTTMLFFGGLLVAVAVEKWDLHKRIALRVLLLVGSKPKWLMFGFMTTTAFLSMWISNTATTAMMVPIAQAVLLQLDEHRQSVRQEAAANGAAAADGDTQDDTNNGRNEETNLLGRQWSTEGVKPVTREGLGRQWSIEGVKPGRREELEGQVILETMVEVTSPGSGSLKVPEKALSPAEVEEDFRFKQMAKALTMCVAYAANIGGTATLTGTGPNLILKGQLDTIFGGGSGINFSSWFVFAFPNMLLCLAGAWLWLQLIFLGPRQMASCLFKSGPKHDETANKVIRAEYDKLGPMSFAEYGVLGHFILLALLWMTREPDFVKGWSYFFEDGYVTDACVVITISFCLFMFPSELPNFMCCRRKGDTRRREPAPALLDWETVHTKMSWSVVIMLGGGFALADACQVSGLSADIGAVFSTFRQFPPWTMVLLLCVITAGLTEFTSNTATATLFLPILALLAQSMEVNPLYLMVPVTISCSFAFMLPVATPPNAIVFAYGHIKVFDMVKAGIVMNLFCLMMLQLAINTWGSAYFALSSFPSWAEVPFVNTTMAPIPLNCSMYIHNLTFYTV